MVEQCRGCAFCTYNYLRNDEDVTIRKGGHQVSIRFLVRAKETYQY
jgi:hypothetical protein